MDTIDDTEVYWIEKDPDTKNTYKIYFKNLNDGTSEVIIKLITPLSEFDDFDDVAFPMGKEGMIFDLVIEKLRGKPAEDILNDKKVNQL